MHQSCDGDLLHTWLVVGDRIHRAHSVLCGPQGRRVHTAHCFVHRAHDCHTYVVAHLHLGQGRQNPGTPTMELGLRRFRLLLKMQPMHSGAAQLGVMRGFPKRRLQSFLRAEGWVELKPTPDPTVMLMPNAYAVWDKQSPTHRSSPRSVRGRGLPGLTHPKGTPQSFGQQGFVYQGGGWTRTAHCPRTDSG